MTTEGDRPGISRRKFLVGAAVGVGATAADLTFLTSLTGAVPGRVANENALPGTPESQWNFDGGQMDDSIEGFPSEVSVNAGETVGFKVKTPANQWRIKIYRLGWYSGKGARLLTTLTPAAGAGNQPAPLRDTSTGLVDCGNWNVSASWAVPATAVSGVHLAIFQRLDTGGINRAWFVVRNDGQASDILVQTSDTTWQAYNLWGDASFYRQDNNASPFWGRAVKVSYNRPLLPPGPEHTFMWSEYPLVRWLERNGYDVAYTAAVDTDRRPAELLNRKVFISSGHDEYWSGQQRANVEAARAAGVNLIFMSGNEVYWKTRWEASPHPGAAPYKTLVCYKETQQDAKSDPTPVWTGTWRDARFSPPSDGGRPENALTGTLFKVINPTNVADFPIEIPATYGGFRMWRNTTVAALLPGQKATLAPSSLGYEWDVDADNGFRPPGLIRLSETTRVGQDVLQNEGTSYITAQATHSMTMYRAPSGALVWGLGTVQWAWGLDEFHDYNPEAPIPADARMQQATLNVLADMGVQPSTRQASLVAATKSTDTVAPTSTFTAPVQNATVPIGSPVVVSGTSADAGGGKVAAVEMSTDGGTTWRQVTGTTSWSFAFTPTSLGQATVKVRAIDDSCNIPSQPAVLTLTVGPRPYPCSIWPSATVPTKVDSGDGNAIEVGVKFRASADGYVTGVRFYKAAGNVGTHIGHIWTAAGTLLGSATFSGETATGWQQASFTTPVPITAGTTYVASAFMPSGRYAQDKNYFASAYDLAPLRALADGEDGPNGVYRYGSTGFPASTFAATNYWVDVTVDNDNHQAPFVLDRSPAPGIQAVAINAAVSATFSEYMKATGFVFTLTDPQGVAVSGSVSYDGPTRTVRFTPAAALAPGVVYTASVRGTDMNNELSPMVTWSFTTSANPGSYPATLWDSSAVPAVASTTDSGSVEVGLRFKSDVDGLISGLRYYRGPSNGGTHVGRLWSAAGTLLGTVAFSNETATGWQQANFSTPIAITKNTIYTVSYHCDGGGYSVTSGDLVSGRDRGPLHAIPASSGGNGVYRYGAASFPTDTYNGANYWVDLVMILAPDTAAPTVVDRSPAPGVNAVAVGSAVAATFSEPVNPATASLSLSGPGGTVAGTKSYDTGANTARFTPTSPLAAGATYTATLAAAADPAGNTMPGPVTWSFTTATAPGSYPATLWDSSYVPAVPSSSDTNAVEVGVRFKSDIDGLITALRFYKGPGNAGTHVGHLWSSSGVLLGTVTFTGETAGGWQQASFSSPVAVTKDAVYVASYHSDTGGYSTTGAGLEAGRDNGALHALANSSGGNGVYGYGAAAMPTNSYNATNYWVDVVMTPAPDTAGPTVVDRSPATGVNAVATDATAAATFNEAVNPATLVFGLSGPGGAVAGSTTYDAVSRTARFTPSAALAANTTYTATVSAARDLAGNPIAAPVSWTFTTAAASGSLPATLWTSAAVPAIPTAPDATPIEVGVRFTADVNGRITGIRFYKGAANTGTHVANLWSAAGTLLATATFTAESSAGWQQVRFPAPVAITAGTTYVASYFAPNGGYSKSEGYFASARDNAPLHAPADGSGGANGLYRYGSTGFPNNTYGASNYWVDVLLEP